MSQKMKLLIAYDGSDGADAALADLHRAGLPLDQREVSKRDLVLYCTQIAEASGGIMGFVGLGRSICREEEEILRQIATELERGPA